MKRYQQFAPQSSPAFPRRSRQNGFSLLEMMMVIAIGLIATAISFIALQPVLKQETVANAYNTTLMALRQARESSVSTRWAYTVTFNNAVSPNTVTVLSSQPGAVALVRTLPQEITFHIEPGIPTSNLQTPDHFGTASNAVDFDQAVSGGVNNVIVFYPDGSAQDAVGNINNGVVYLGRPGDLYSSRAITLWGVTGRLRGWRLYSNGGVNQWVQQ